MSFLLSFGAIFSASLDFRCVSAGLENNTQHTVVGRGEVRQLVGSEGSHPRCSWLRSKLELAKHYAYGVRDSRNKSKAKEEDRRKYRELNPSQRRMTDSLTMMIENILEDEIPGGIMETGVHTGFSSMVMSAVLSTHGVSGREEYFCDSFNGLPRPSAALYPEDKGSKFWMMKKHYLGGPAITQANFDAVGLTKPGRQHWEVGFFNESMPGLVGRVGRLAILRLDGDMFESTWQVLHAMYPKLEVGGYLVVDDFDISACNSAIHKFRSAFDITEQIIPPMVPALWPLRVGGPRLHGREGGDRNAWQGSYWRVEKKVTIPESTMCNIFPRSSFDC